MGRKSGLFRALTLVSRLPVRGAGGGNRRKSPAFSANIPVLERPWAETGLLTTAAPIVALRLGRFSRPNGAESWIL